MTMTGLDNSDNMTIPENASPTVLAGRYRIVRKLGEGGMGSVWFAEDTKLDGRKVAIKMLPSILVNNKRAYAQVKAEALVSLKLSHPNIVTVRAFEEDDGNPFLVMDYLHGKTLDEYLAERTTISQEETYALLKPIAEALDYAHSQGVAHRDVKPGNVMIAEDGKPYVLDFGIAREVQETMTRITGKLSSGTLMYMSPEQLRGEKVTAKQDVYSFAVMAYECLAGEPPFCRGQIEYQILNELPRPLSNESRLTRGVMQGLAKSPDERPHTCVDVLNGVFGHVDDGKDADKTENPKQEVQHRGVTGELSDEALAKMRKAVSTTKYNYGIGRIYLPDDPKFNLKWASFSELAELKIGRKPQVGCAIAFIDCSFLKNGKVGLLIDASGLWALNACAPEYNGFLSWQSFIEVSEVRRKHCMSRIVVLSDLPKVGWDCNISRGVLGVSIGVMLELFGKLQAYAKKALCAM